MLKTTLATALLAVAGTAQAATLLTAGATAPAALPSSISYDFVGGAGAGSLSFELRGHTTLDGQGAIDSGIDYSDLFTLTLNGTAIYSGYFVLGGIGSQNILTAPAGASTVAVHNGLNLGGSLSVSTAVTLIEGINTLKFAYTTGNPQPIGDEAWSIASVSLSGNAPAPAGVPEPATWAMLMLGFGLVGAAARRRRTIALA